MAAATVTIAVDQGGIKTNRVFNDIDMAHVWGTITISASPDTYVTGGLPLNWTFNVPGFVSSFPPYHVNLFRVGSTASYIYQWNAATGTLQIFLAAGTELTAAAIPAAVSGDKIRFEAIVQRG